MTIVSFWDLHRSNVLYIAKTYMKMGNTDEARSWLQTALEKPSDNTFDDEKAAKEAQELLDSL